MHSCQRAALKLASPACPLTRIRRAFTKTPHQSIRRERERETDGGSAAAALCGLEFPALEAPQVLGCSGPLVFKAPDHLRCEFLRARLFLQFLLLTSRSVLGGLKPLPDLLSLLLSLQTLQRLSALM